MSPSIPTRSDLSLGEMLHVLDVARTLRRDSEIVDAELNHDQLVASLKARLLAAAGEAGDRVTEAEVDTAIRIYFDNLHKYVDPPWSPRVFLAHLYIRRRMLLASAIVWGMFVLLAKWWWF